jgi:beta-galactosidase
MLKVPFNFDWTRTIGNGMGFFMFGQVDETPVNLPDDFIINLPRDPKAESGAASGYFPGGQATYKKRFSTPQYWAGKTILLDVDGAYMNAEVMLNGEKIGYNPYGYTPFFSDMTPHISTQKDNELKIITQCRQPNSRWYSGGGLYREVNVWIGDIYYIHPWATFITTPEVSAEKAIVNAKVDITNTSGNAANVQVIATVIDNSGKDVISNTLNLQLAPSGDTAAEFNLPVTDPKLWDTEFPNLYVIKFEIVSGGKIYDTFTQNFGIRKIEIDAKNGMRVNGKPVKLRGGCIHHDNTLLGACAYPRAEERKIQILKEAGYNAIRTAHNPPSRAMLDVCDRLGMYVLDESFDCWTMGKNGQDYHLYFEDWWQRDTRAMVLRDRNHPCIYCWSIGNEIAEMTGVESGGYWSKVQADYVRSLDPTRPVTAAIHGIINFSKAELDLDIRSFHHLQGTGTPGVINGVDYWAEQTAASSEPLDIVGYNYIHQRYASDAEKYPDRVIHGTETHPLTTYDYWQATLANSNVIGDFIWTAYDNLGEAGAGRVIWDKSDPKEAGFMGSFPWISCYQGDMNLDGDRRPQSYFRKIMWGLDDGIHLFTTHPSRTGVPFYGSGWHWPDVKKNWTFEDDYIGKPVKVEAYCDCDEVEFFVNGRSVGKAKSEKLVASLEIPYEPGILEAVAIRNGEPSAKDRLTTSGAPAKIVLTPDRTVISADGLDLCFIHATVLDADNNPVITSEVELSAKVEGAGVLAGFGSGNPCTPENYGTGKRLVFDGRALLCVRAGRSAGDIRIDVSADGLESASITICCK